MFCRTMFTIPLFLFCIGNFNVSSGQDQPDPDPCQECMDLAEQIEAATQHLEGLHHEADALLADIHVYRDQIRHGDWLCEILTGGEGAGDLPPTPSLDGLLSIFFSLSPEDQQEFESWFEHYTGVSFWEAITGGPDEEGDWDLYWDSIFQGLVDDANDAEAYLCELNEEYRELLNEIADAEEFLSDLLDEYNDLDCCDCDTSTANPTIIPVPDPLFDVFPVFE